MVLGIIPARFASTRFPGKPLIDIQGKTMIQRVYEAAQASDLSDVVVATDDERIAEHVIQFGGKVVLTGENHPSGTDRCWEAYTSWTETHHKNAEPIPYVLNIQGDEPFLDPQQINELISILDGNVELATQMIRIDSAEALHDPGEAKIIFNENREVILFSRQAIPYLRNIPSSEWHLRYPYFRHVGMYAYRRDILEKITQLPPSPLEMAESLEQLRWLEAGYKIKVVETGFDSHCVDTPEDVEKILRLLNK